MSVTCVCGGKGEMESDTPWLCRCIMQWMK